MDYFPSSKVSAQLKKLPTAMLRTAARAIESQIRRRDVYFHFKRDVKRYIPMALKPWIVTTKQTDYLGAASRLVQSAALRVYRRWFRRPDLQKLMPLTETEQRWVSDAYGGDFVRPETMMARADVATQLGLADWKRRMKFLEINLCGIGATYYCHSAARIAGEVIAPLLGVRGVGFADDLMDMIMGQCRTHGAKIGRPDPVVALMEYRRCNEGPFEYETMARLYTERGYRVIVADPIELEVRRGELWAGKTRVDILYRDPTLLDLIWMEEQGDDLRAVKHAFRKNQVVSSLGGEMDHKSLFEIFSSPAYERMFAARERVVLRRHIPWTRVVRDETAEEIRRRRTRLVIKPNREYGGKGIQIGNRVTVAAWDRVIEDGVRHPARYVAQERIEFNEDDYPILENGRVRWRKRFVVTGVHATPSGTAILARMSEEPVVNITRGGAIVGVLRLPSAKSV